MKTCRLLAGIVPACCACAVALAQSQPDALPTAESIMARVAANQDRAEAERAHYVYVQHATMASRHGKQVKC